MLYRLSYIQIQVDRTSIGCHQKAVYSKHYFQSSPLYNQNEYSIHVPSANLYLRSAPFLQQLDPLSSMSATHENSANNHFQSGESHDLPVAVPYDFLTSALPPHPATSRIAVVAQTEQATDSRGEEGGSSYPPLACLRAGRRTIASSRNSRHSLDLLS